MFILKRVLLFSLVFMRFQSSSCICKQSYQIICDTVADYEKFNDGTWTDVLIKSNANSGLKKVPFNTVKFKDLTSVTIVGQINQLDDTENTCVYEVKLKSLNFYGNSIKSIKEGNFLRFLNLHKLGLVSNGIETVQKKAFALPRIEVIDLSDNKIEKIYSGTFTNELSKRRTVTRKIFIRNNKLSNIEPNSFPHSLEILNLDNNNLTTLRDEVINDLPYLQGLYLSNNQLSVLPNVTGLYNLRILDVSFNRINNIDSEMLKNLRHLQFLDLTRNLITRVAFLKSPLLKSSPMEIYLNFNLVQSLDGLDINGTLSDKILNVYENPWLCDQWPSVENYMKKINLQRGQCELGAYKASDVSFCRSSYSKPLEEFVEEFYNEISIKGYLLKCDNVRKTYNNLFYKINIDVRCF